MIKQTMWNCVFLWPRKQTLMISDREHSIDQGSERARLAISAAAAASSGAAAANWGIRGGEDITGRRKHWHLYGNVKLSEKNLSVFLSHTHTHTANVVWTSVYWAVSHSLESSTTYCCCCSLCEALYMQHCSQQMCRKILSSGLRWRHFASLMSEPQITSRCWNLLTLGTCSSSHLHLVNSFNAAEITAADDCEIELYNSRCPRLSHNQEPE